jgi:hypothetical protein
MSTWHEKLANRKQDQLDAERKKLVEVNDISFPSLTENSWGGAGAAAGGAGGPAPKPKLASLLVEWDAKAEEEKLRKAEAAAAEAKKNTTYSSYIYNHSKYRFGNTHSRDEDTYYEDEYEDDELPPLPTADSSSDWRTVERPVRKPKKTAVEKMMEEPELLEPPIEETSVWQTEGVWERER